MLFENVLETPGVDVIAPVLTEGFEVKTGFIPEFTTESTEEFPGELNI